MIKAYCDCESKIEQQQQQQQLDDYGHNTTQYVNSFC